MYKIQPFSHNFSFHVNEKQTRGIKCMKNIIQDLERYGPAGLIHITVLSNIIGKSIKIWNYDGSLNRIIGKEKKGCPIDIEYHPMDSEHTQIGHWTLRHGKNPDNTTVDLNSCLFSVIGYQTGQDPSKLRKQLLLILKRNLQELAYQVNEIIRLKRNDGIILMIGGACYKGQSPTNAARILDNSQNAECHNCTQRGHPRGHASDPDATGAFDSVEQYTKTTKSPKTAFLSRTDQDLVAHLALTTKQAKNAMNDLNRPINTISERIQAKTLEIAAIQLNKTLPKVKYYDQNGNPVGNEVEIQEVVLVMRHHKDKWYDRHADVFVHTFYPVIN